MWTLHSAPRALTVAVAFVAGQFAAVEVRAQSTQNGYQYPSGYSNQTYSYGLYLPQVPQPNGQDEIRAADGTTCRSSMASNNAYLDVGAIGGQGTDGQFDSGTVYGRVIVPLGFIPKRLDCSSLYGLEIERLRHELELLRSGISGSPMSAVPMPGMKDKAWAETGWTNKGASAQGKAPITTQSIENSKSAAAPNVVPARDGIVPEHGRKLLAEVEKTALHSERSPLHLGAPPVAHAAPEAQVITAVLSSDETEEILPWLVQAVASSERAYRFPRGYIAAEDEDWRQVPGR